MRSRKRTYLRIKPVYGRRYITDIEIAQKYHDSWQSVGELCKPTCAVCFPNPTPSHILSCETHNERNASVSARAGFNCFRISATRAPPFLLPRYVSIFHLYYFLLAGAPTKRIAFRDPRARSSIFPPPINRNKRLPSDRVLTNDIIRRK